MHLYEIYTSIYYSVKYSMLIRKAKQMDEDDDHSEDSSKGGREDGESSVVPPFSLAVIESLTIPLVQEVVISANLGCVECQKRINDVISRFNAETESIIVSLSEKKIVMTLKYIRASKTRNGSCQWRNKVALIKRIFGSSTA